MTDNPHVTNLHEKAGDDLALKIRVLVGELNVAAQMAHKAGLEVCYDLDTVTSIESPRTMTTIQVRIVRDL